MEHAPRLPEIPRTLDRFFTRHAPLEPGDAVVAAFSGGPDSTALLLGLRELARRRRISVIAAHLDHGMDEGAAGRAALARETASVLGVPWVEEKRPVQASRIPGESLEATARRIRYEFLEGVRRRCEARYVVTAHHLDDQAETVLLRMLFGSGLDGLAGIQPVADAVVRPFLPLAKDQLIEYLSTATQENLSIAVDPTNRDPSQPRGLWRRFGLHRLAGRAGDIPRLQRRLARVAARALGARAVISRLLEETLRFRPVRGGVGMERAAFMALPRELRRFALAELHRGAGVEYPAPRPARRELSRQLASGSRLGCDCGGQWRWESEGDTVILRRRQARQPFFTYTFRVPGGVEIPDLSIRFDLRQATPQSLGAVDGVTRAALSLSLSQQEEVIVRNRRPGDRIRPLGRRSPRRLKEILIDRRIPRLERDRIPLLCIDGRVAWVPGIALDERFRVTGRDDESVWLAEIAPSPPEGEILRSTKLEADLKRTPGGLGT